MTKYVLDSYAWIEYFTGGRKGEKVREIIENPSNEVFTSVITISEVCAKTKKEKRDHEEAFRKIMALSQVEGIEPVLAKEAGVFRQETREKVPDFGMADSIIFITARKLGAKIVSGDKHFKNFKEAVFLD